MIQLCICRVSFLLLLLISLCRYHQCFKVITEGGAPENHFLEHNMIAIDLPLPAVSTKVVTVTGIGAAAAFLVIQAHVQHPNISLIQPSTSPSSHSSPSHFSNSSAWLVSGQHVAQVVLLGDGATSARVTLANPNQHDTVVLVVVTLYSDLAPIPGGCSRQSSLPSTAYIDLHRGPPLNRFTVPRAQIAVNRSADSACDSTATSLRYRTYVSLPRDSDIRANYDLFRDTLIAAISPSLLQQLAAELDSPRPSADTDDLRVAAVTHECQTMIFSVLAFRAEGAVGAKDFPLDSGLASVYAPAVFYACPTVNFWKFTDCPLLGSLDQLLVALTLLLPAVWLLVPQPSGRFSLHSRLLLCCIMVLATALWATLLLLVTRRTFTSLVLAYTMSSLLAMVLAEKLELYIRHLSVQTQIDDRAICKLKMYLAPVFVVFVCTFVVFALFVAQAYTRVFADGAIFWATLSMAVVILTSIVLSFDSHKAVGFISCVMGSVWLATAFGLMIGAVLPYAYVDLFRRALESSYGSAHVFISLQWTDAFIIMFTLVVFIISHCHYIMHVDAPVGDVTFSVYRFIRVLRNVGGGVCRVGRRRPVLLVDDDVPDYGSTKRISPVAS